MTETVALTGASGFIGRTLAKRLPAGGRSLRVLLRRPDRELEGLAATPVIGTLEDRESLDRLVAGCDLVVHCAGAVKACKATQFHAVNAVGTARLAEAAAAAGVRRFLLMSSLAAREPALSAYAASKQAGEEAIKGWDGQLDFCVLRAPGVYGPGDRATLPLFAQMARGLLLVPALPEARFSLIHVDDLAAAILRLLEVPAWQRAPLEIDDARPGGYGWADLARLASRSLGRRVRTVALPRSLLWGPAQISQVLARLSGRAAYFTPGKLRELYHPDWLARPAEGGPLAGWQAQVSFDQGFAETLAWYRAEGWLPAP